MLFESNKKFSGQQVLGHKDKFKYKYLKLVQLKYKYQVQQV